MHSYAGGRQRAGSKGPIVLHAAASYRYWQSVSRVIESSDRKHDASGRSSQDKERFDEPRDRRFQPGYILRAAEKHARCRDRKPLTMALELTFLHPRHRFCRLPPSSSSRLVFQVLACAIKPRGGEKFPLFQLQLVLYSRKKSEIEIGWIDR